MKNYSGIENLLEKYWACETSAEEEHLLETFFLQNENLPARIEHFRPLFDYRAAQRTERVSDDFDEKLLMKMKPKRRRIIFATSWKVAAGIVLAASTSLFVYHHKMNENRVELAEARETVIETLCLISDNIEQSQEIITGGLKQFDILCDVK